MNYVNENASTPLCYIYVCLEKIDLLTSMHTYLQ